MRVDDLCVKMGKASWMKNAGNHAALYVTQGGSQPEDVVPITKTVSERWKTRIFDGGSMHIRSAKPVRSNSCQKRAKHRKSEYNGSVINHQRDGLRRRNKAPNTTSMP